MQFTKEELHAIANLLNRVSIQGNEATVVALLQQKIAEMLRGVPTLPTLEEAVRAKPEKN